MSVVGVTSPQPHHGQFPPIGGIAGRLALAAHPPGLDQALGEAAQGAPPLAQVDVVQQGQESLAPFPCRRSRVTAAQGPPSRVEDEGRVLTYAS